MKENFIHVCFIVDRSGSMYGSEQDVIGGFKKVIDEQKANTDGTCSVSLYEFDDEVKEIYKGKDVKEIDDIDYSLGGCTALFDGVGTAIDNIGKWLSDMDESERPEKNLIVIMTDGGENASREYSGTRIREMIKHQEEKYSWSFIYMGSDLTDAKDANVMGISTRLYSSKASLSENYCLINSAVSGYRGSAGPVGVKRMAMDAMLSGASFTATAKYAADNNLKIEDLLDNSAMID